MKVFISLLLLSFLNPSDSAPNISGSYKVVAIDESSVCNLGLFIDQSKKTFKFNGVSSAKDKFTIFKDGDEQGIIFKGLKYAEYDSSFEDKPDVSGALLQDTIIIQNYGNSMNEYLKISGCEEKFIYLIRQK